MLTRISSVDKSRTSVANGSLLVKINSPIRSTIAALLTPYGIEVICRIRLPPVVTNFARPAQLDRSLTGGIDLAQFFLGVDDLATCRKIGSLNGVSGDQLVVFDLWITEQLQQRVADFVQIVRRNVGGHSDSDARCHR